MGKLICITVDCAKPAPLARFWAAAIEGYDVRPYDQAEVQRLREAGVMDIEDDPTVAIDAQGLPTIFFQRVPEPKTVKNRVHLDIQAAHREAEVQRLVSLGARVFRELDEGGQRWTIMQDPEGNEFCVSQG